MDLPEAIMLPDDLPAYVFRHYRGTTRDPEFTGVTFWTKYQWEGRSEEKNYHRDYGAVDNKLIILGQRALLRENTPTLPGPQVDG